MIEDDDKSRNEWLLKKANFNGFIETYIDFLNLIRDNVSSSFALLDYSEKLFVIPRGCPSSIDALEGIKSLLINGDVIDSYVLVRKIRDNLFLDLVLLNEAYKDKPYFKEPSFDFMKDNTISFAERSDAFLAMIAKELIEEAKSHVEDETYQSLKRWNRSKISSKDKAKFFGYSHYYDYLKSPSVPTSKVSTLFSTSLSNVEKHLNNYVHGNGAIFGDNIIYKNSYKAFFNQIKSIRNCLSIIMMYFASCVFMINGTLFHSSDYLDALDIEITPNEELKYEIAPSCQNILDEIKEIQPEVYDLLVKSNKFQMNIKREKQTF